MYLFIFTSLNNLIIFSKCRSFSVTQGNNNLKLLAELFVQISFKFINKMGQLTPFIFTILELFT